LLNCLSNDDNSSSSSNNNNNGQDKEVVEVFSNLGGKNTAKCKGLAVEREYWRGTFGFWVPQAVKN
jgi:hypothetical protein